MNADRLMQCFDQISEAPGAISLLRQFILDLAVRGKLVEQNPGDEPVDALVAAIEAERQRRIGTGKVNDLVTAVFSKSGRYPIPESWRWIRLGFLVNVVMGQSPPGDTYNTSGEGIALINGPVEFSPGPFGVTVVNQYTTAPTKLCRKGDFLLCVRASTGRTNVAGNDACIGRGVAALQPLFDDRFVRLVIWAWRDEIVKMGRGMTFPSISRQQIEELAVPLPPLPEQHRIVSRVDELMRLCDALEAAQAECEVRRDHFVAATFHKLGIPATDKLVGTVSSSDTSVFFTNLPRLITRSEHVQQLRQTIVRLALHGKLVSQQPGELARMVVAEQVGRERSQAGLPTHISGGSAELFKEAEQELRVPSSWAVVPLSEVALALVDCPHATPDWTVTGKICVRTNQFQPGFLDLSDSRFVSEETYLERVARLRPTQDDILYSREGGILGVACRVPPGVELCLGQRMLLIRPASVTYPAFLELILNSPLIKGLAAAKTIGGAAPRVNVSTVKSFPIPVPPLAEQQAILETVHNLLRLTDELDRRIADGEVTRRELLEALLHEALGN